MASEATPSRRDAGPRGAALVRRLMKAAATVMAAAAGTLALHQGLWVTGGVLMAVALGIALYRGRRHAVASDAADETGPPGRVAQSGRGADDRIRVRLTPDNALICETPAARDLFGVSGVVRPAPEALASVLQARPMPGGCPIVTVALHGIDRHFGVLWPDPAEGASAQLIDLTAVLIAQRADAVQAFMTLSSHELMNGITPLVSLAQSARDQIAAGEPDAARGTLDMVGAAAQRMLVLIEAFRTMARLPRPQPRPLRLGPILDEAVALARARWSDATVTLRVEPTVAARLVRLDRDLMLQAIANLINNGAEAALSAAEAAAEAAATPAAVTVEARIVDQHLSVAISDTGPGVPAELAEQVFQPFFTTRDRGSGVGLPLAAQIASVHGGWLQLLPQSPTTFVLTIADCVLPHDSPLAPAERT